MKQERLNLYLIDMKYIRNMHNADDKVSSVSPQIGKQHRIYVGIVILCNNRKYLIPLSHAVAKHTKMKPRADKLIFTLWVAHCHSLWRIPHSHCDCNALTVSHRSYEEDNVLTL